MKWFNKLKRSIRIAIAVASWIPLVVFAGVISGSIGDNGENIQGWQTAVVLILLAVGIVFTVFAVLARRQETKAAREAKAVTNGRKPSKIDLQRAVLKSEIAENKSRQAELRQQISAMENGAQANIKRKPAPLPKYQAMLKIIVFDNRINGLEINEGDQCVIKFEDDRVMRSSNGHPIVDANCYVGGVKIGLFPYCKNLRALYGKNDYYCNIAKTELIDGKWEICVNIDLPFKIDSKLPLSTKLVGVTFNERQKTLAESVTMDRVNIVHNPSEQYPNTIEVINSALDSSIGVLPSEIGEKLLKKYKAGCKFEGVITSIYGGGVERNYGVDIMILANV